MKMNSAKLLEIRLPSRIAVPANFDLTSFFALMAQARQIEECYSGVGFTGDQGYAGDSTFYACNEDPIKVAQLNFPLYENKADAQAAKTEIARVELEKRRVLKEEQLAREVKQETVAAVPASDVLPQADF